MTARGTEGGRRSRPGPGCYRWARRSRLRASRLPLRQAGSTGQGSPRATKGGSSISRWAHLAIRRHPRCSRRSRARGTERGYPSSVGSRSTASRPRVDVAPLRRRTSAVAVRRMCRDQGVRFRRSPLAAAAHADARHRALPGARLSDLRDGRNPRPLSGRDGAEEGRTGPWTSRRSRPRTLRERSVCGSTVRGTRRASSRTSAAAARWGRAHGVPVFSDECYVEFTWAGPGHTILEHGPDGVVAVHSLSKRSNLAGLRAGFFAGDGGPGRLPVQAAPACRVHGPGPIQRAGAVALGDDAHVGRQRAVYLERLTRFAGVLGARGIPARVPDGSFYLWVAVPGQVGSDDRGTDSEPGLGPHAVARGKGRGSCRSR